MKARDYKSKYIIVTGIVLLISLVANIYQGLSMNEYKQALKKESYENIENIRYTNDSILTILQGSVKAKKITNEELLLLYTSYNNLAECDTVLWKEYVKDEHNLFGNKVGDTSELVDTQVFWNIEKMLYGYLIANSDSMEMGNEILEVFITMKLLSEEISNMYIDFYKDNCNGLENEDREKRMIKKDYWIEIFEEIQSINSKYIDYPFIYEENTMET